MANAETTLKVLLAATGQWLKGRELPLADLTGVPQALWMLQGALEDIHHHLTTEKDLPKERLALYDGGLTNAGLLMAFMHSQPADVMATLRDDLDDINKVLYQAEMAMDKLLRPWLL